MAGIVRPAEPRDDPALARLFALYADEYAFELGDQDVIGEGRQARAYYRDGLVLVAEADGAVVGCVCLEPWGPGRCRMKRMIVDPQHRGGGHGRRLSQAILDAAAAAGYHEMCLDTTRPMTAATGLYQSLGFEVWDGDYEVPCRGTVFMRRALSTPKVNLTQ